MDKWRWVLFKGKEAFWVKVLEFKYEKWREIERGITAKIIFLVEGLSFNLWWWEYT